MKFLTALVLITLIFGLSMTFGATIMERRDDKDVNNKDKDYHNRYSCCHHNYHFPFDHNQNLYHNNIYDDYHKDNVR